ncbi:MAG: PilZ domain-containing protein, partial [Treponema sp.]|nr:PilZ domain-containing protein [Treponema sp.]
TRYRGFARVRFSGQLGEESLLKDISITGCRVECTSLMNLKPDIQYTMEMIPEAAAKIGRFDLEVKSIWIRPGDYSSDVGFSIIASPKGKLFQRYVDYLAWRETHPDRVAKVN